MAQESVGEMYDTTKFEWVSVATNQAVSPRKMKRGLLIKTEFREL